MFHHDPIETMKRYARRLVKNAQAENLPPLIVKRFAMLPDLDEETLPSLVKHRHGLTVTAKLLGFEGWSHIVHVIEGKRTDDYGKVLCGKAGAFYPNIWETDLETARKFRDEHGGTLLPYKNQFLIVEDGYLEAHSIPADLPEWEKVGRDWTNPGDLDARARLYERRIEAALDWQFAADEKEMEKVRAKAKAKGVDLD